MVRKAGRGQLKYITQCQCPYMADIGGNHRGFKIRILQGMRIPSIPGRMNIFICERGRKVHPKIMIINKHDEG